MLGRAYFRFLNLSDELADDLQSSVPNAGVEPHFKVDAKVGCIELLGPADVVQIAEFKRKNKIPATECDVFVSIASEKSSEVWRAPKLVNYVVKIVNCPILFSFSSGQAEKLEMTVGHTSAHEH